MHPNIHPAKKAAGEKAVEFISSGMTVGLGTGSTAYWAILKIGEKVTQGLQIKGIATSVQSEELARQLNIPLITPSEIDHIDVDIDGADEVDEQFNLIKGGGGALLREKIIAAASKKMIIVADQSKLVKQLGKFPLSVEVIPFGWEMTIKKLQELCGKTTLRYKNDKRYITDNNNYIIDCSFDRIPSPAELHSRLNNIPGVIENGLFVDKCDTVVVGYEDGETEVRIKEKSRI